MNLIQILQMTEVTAREYLEQIRWPNGAICPKCNGNNVLKLSGASTRPGLYKCRDCRKAGRSPQFTVTVGTIFEDSHIPLNKWVGAFYMFCSFKKGVSAKQLERDLGVSYKSAWFMAHRVREALREGYFGKLTGVVEADETYVGGRERGTKAYGGKGKTPVVALVQRDGKVRTKVLPKVTVQNLGQTIFENVSIKATLMTDSAMRVRNIGRMFARHEMVNHGKGEYVRGDVTTNTVECYFGLLKRGIYGTWHHVSKHHLSRYVDEFNFRWNNNDLSNTEMLEIAVKQTEGKRLTFKARSEEKLA